MKRFFKCRKLSLIGIILSTTVIFSSGCATYKTVSTAKYGSSVPKIYSGTHLNIYAISDNRYELKRMGVEPPKYPVLDLPASLVLDTVMLPLSVTSVVSEKLGL